MTNRETLFGVEEETGEVRRVRVTGPVAGVALEDSLDKLLDYSIPSRLVTRVAVGQRVKVPLGKRNRAVSGYVVVVKEGSDYPRVKDLLEIEDERVLVTPGLLELSRWMSRYYCAPLGTVLESVIPAAVKKRVGMGYVQMVRVTKTREELQELFEKNKAKKRRAILGRLMQLEEGEAIELGRLASEAGATAPTVRKLAGLGVIGIRAEADLDWAEEGSGFGVQGSGEEEGVRSTLNEVVGDGEHRTSNNEHRTSNGKTDGAGEVVPELNEDQGRVFGELGLRVRDGGFSVNLLFGVTGSGKTEIYLRCIEEVVAGGKQAIVLVPEIALTPQTVRRFTARFSRVAVLHSGLTQSQRHRFWQQCASGRADVVVGARSAVFAPVPRLGMIVVDEEHEASYKQDQAPRYSGRDVAIKRGQIEGAAVVLGSATPSLESYSRVQGSGFRVQEKTERPTFNIQRSTSKVGRGEGEEGEHRTSNERARGGMGYHLLSLPRRVRGLSMPHVELVDLKLEGRLRPDRGHIHVISTRLEHLLRVTVEKGQQAILLLNRRGYSNFVYCVSCQEPLKCQYCDTTMTYHRAAAAHAHSGTHAEAVHKGGLQCHYCLATSPLPEKCPTCSKKLSLFGLGTQRVEEELAKKFPDVKFARVDSDSMHSAKDYEALLGRFARNEIQVMLGTQMIAKGLDYPNVTLVGVISGDTSLSLPDFRAAERTFQLITQVAGRAGRGDNPGRVVLQTFMPDDPTIQAALRQDFVGFAQSELQSRREVGLPPFARMVRIVMRDQDQEVLHEKSEEVGVKVMEAVSAVQGASAIVVKGPMPCAINRIAGFYRNQIVMQCGRAEPLQKVLLMLREGGHLATSDRIAVDVDPVSLL